MRPDPRAWLLGLAMVCSACADSGGREPAGAPGEAPASAAPLSVGEVLRQSAALRGRTVIVSGRFAGWEGRCAGAPPRTRSDWMLVDAPHCVYVSGPVPAGLSAPPDIRSNGQAVMLKARVELTDDGRPYLVN